ncbi:sodium:solute symporter [candidate division KSB1 bacterium]|nr:sodium:solute symporter [candidate division KSB1 bacterium]
MNYLNSVDYTVIVVYLTILIGLGFYLQKRASQSIQDYFLGGNTLPWWALGISGMASYLDIAGTMLIVSFLFILGPRGLFIEFRGGACLLLSFTMIWAGKWHYRSKCMTGAEWMEYRFGSGWGGQFARVVSATANIIGTVGTLAYLIKGVGLFLSMFLPFSPLVCSLILIGVATLYTMASGFYGVVFTDVFQSVIIFVAVIFISVMAVLKITNVADFVALTEKVTGNHLWMSSGIQWKTVMPRGYEAYQHLMLFTFFYFLRSVVGGVAEGADPKYFGARNERECGSLSFLWIALLMLRWPMMMGFAVLGIYLVNDLFPDQLVMLHAADIIKSFITNASPERWQDILAGIMNSPGNYPQELITGLKELFHSNWQYKLHLLSFDGTVNPERILPAVLLFTIPMGLRGLLLVALIAACMSSFDTHVNRTSAFFIRDIYQRYLRPRAKNRELIIGSYFFIFVLVAVSYSMAYTVKSINDIWGWIVMGLGSGLIIPAMFKFYWWRFNGGGFAVGTIVGLIAAFVQRAFFPELVEWQQFIILSLISLIATIIGTYLTSPIDTKVINHFYATTRPFGFWGPIKQKLKPEIRIKMSAEHKNDLIALPFTLGWQITLFLLPMQLIIHSYNTFKITLLIFIFCFIGMYWFWYRNLPPKGKAFSDSGKDSNLSEDVYLTNE